MNQIKFIQQVGRGFRSTDRLKEAFISLGESGQIGANAGTKLLMCWLLAAIKTNLRRTILYQLPKSTFTDHLKDCFGWLAYKPKIDHRLSQYSRAMINMFADKVPVSTPLFAITDGAGPFINGEEIEIDIIRGDQHANNRH